jgi:hypothetical protein
MAKAHPELAIPYYVLLFSFKNYVTDLHYLDAATTSTSLGWFFPVTSLVFERCHSNIAVDLTTAN